MNLSKILMFYFANCKCRTNNAMHKKMKSLSIKRISQHRSINDIEIIVFPNGSQLTPQAMFRKLLIRLYFDNLQVLSKVREAYFKHKLMFIELNLLELFYQSIYRPSGHYTGHLILKFQVRVQPYRYIFKKSFLIFLFFRKESFFM